MKKIKAFQEEKKDLSSTFCPNPIQPKKKPTPSKRSGDQRGGGKQKIRKLDMSKFENLKAKRATSFPLVQPQHQLPPQPLQVVPSNHMHKNCVIYVHPMENCALLLPQVLIGQMKIGTERQRQRKSEEKERTTEKGERRQTKGER